MLIDNNNSAILWVMMAGSYRSGHGMALGNGIWTGEATISGLETFDGRTQSFSFEDFRLDVNGSGRFNALDRDALQLLLGSMDPEVLSKYDFNSSQVIDASDVGFLTTLITNGLDSGVLGDYNASGVFNCADYSAMQPFPSTHLGLPDYRIRLDANLDGILDNSDFLTIASMINCSPGGGKVPESIPQ